MVASRVGATSPSTPSVFFRLQPSGALAMTKGTLLVVWEVLGVPSSVSISSALLECVSHASKGAMNVNLPVIGSDEQDISAFFALIVDLLNSLVGLCACFNGRLIDTSVTNHVWWCKVVHEELEFACSDALAQLLCDGHGAHLRLQVVRGYLGRRNHLALLVLELLLDTTIEEESDVSILFSLCNVALLDALLSQCLRKDVCHSLWLEGDIESVFGVVRGHGGEVNVLGVREVGLGRAVDITQQLSDFSNAVGTVVEEEDSVVIWTNQQEDMQVLSIVLYLEFFAPFLRQ
jgi:hypothetical protein